MGKKVLIAVVVLALIAAVAFFGVQMYANKAVAKEVDAVAARTADSFTLTYGGARADIFNKTAYVSDVTITPLVDGSEPAHIATVIVHDIDLGSEFPTYMHIALEGIDLDPEILGKWGQSLKAMGYDQMKCNFEIDYRYDTEGKELFINKVSIGVDDLGVLNFSTHLSNIDLTGGPMALLFTFPNIVIHKEEASFVDDSFTGRLTELLSRNMGISVEEVKGMMYESIDVEIDAAPDKASKEVYNAVRSFIENPTRITISVNPPEPVALMALQEADKAEVTRILNITITN